MDNTQQPQRQPLPGSRPVFPNQTVPSTQAPQVQPIPTAPAPVSPAIQPLQPQPLVQQEQIPVQPIIQEPVQPQVVEQMNNVPQQFLPEEQQLQDQPGVGNEELGQQFDPNNLPLPAPNGNPLRQNGLLLLLAVGGVSVVMYLIMRFVL